MRHCLFLMLITFFSPVSGASETEGAKSKVVVIAMQGQISKKMLESVRATIGQVKGDPLPAGLIVLLDSPGGDGFAAMKIGRLLRKANAHIFVTGNCASACIFVLASGVVRGASAYSVGIHRGRITLSDANAKIIKEVDIKEDPSAQKLLQNFEREASSYFAEMGMPSDLFRAMQAHQQKGVYRLSGREVIFYGLSGYDPEYLNKRQAALDGQKEIKRMDSDELVRRTAKVASRCAEFDKKHQEFIACYKNVLQDPYLN